MRKVFHILVWVGLFLPFLLSAQISNIQVSAEGNDIIILYDYIAHDMSIDDVIVTYTSGNDTVPKEAKQLVGDINGITPGMGKRIVWSPLNEMDSLSADNLVIHLNGIRDFSKQSQCDNSLKLADRFFTEKDYVKAEKYYQEMLDCPSCNCNPKDIRYAGEQIKLAQKKSSYENAKDSYNFAYLFDMATTEAGGNMHGVSAFLLRNKGVGYYASFRSNKHYYTPMNGMSYYTEDETSDNYTLEPLNSTNVSSWLFSTGLTGKIIRHEFLTAHFYAGVGLGSNSLAQEYNVTETGYKDKNWVTEGKNTLFISPEAGVIANVYDYISVMAGLKYPFSITNSDDFKMKGLSFMVGVGVKLKTLEPNSNLRNSTYVAYTFDMPDKAGPDKLQSANIIGLSAGTISYKKVGGYFSARINPVLFNTKKVEEELAENATYTGVSDYGNAFGTIGLTWMYFYGGIGVSYQKEYKSYTSGGTETWTSSRSKLGACTEFGVNLRLFDRLLLRGGVTMPHFSINSNNNIFTMSSDKMYYSIGIGYVLPSAY